MKVKHVPRKIKFSCCL